MKGASDTTSRRWLCGSTLSAKSRPPKSSVRAYLRPQAKVTLVRPVAVEQPDRKPLLVYLPGTDGTGNSITPQLPGLVAAGFDIRSLYITREDRSNWDSLTQQTVPLIRQLTAAAGLQAKVTLVAESFGGCLAFRLALAAPELVENMVVVNSATCFNKSYNGVVNLIAATQLLALFPEQLYQVAQAVLVPLLVNKEKIGPSSLKAIKSMMVMEPPLNFQAGSQAVAVEEFASSAASSSSRLSQYQPSGTASWRMNMMSEGNLPDAAFRQIRTKVLLVGSGRDRLLPSLTEQARLQRLLPNSQRLLLPESGHTALLEADVDLVSIMSRTGFLPERPPGPSATTALVSQGSHAAASVAATHQPDGSSQNGRHSQPQPDAIDKGKPAQLGLADAATAQRPLAAPLSAQAKEASRVNSSQETPSTASSNGTSSSSTPALLSQQRHSTASARQHSRSSSNGNSSSSGNSSSNGSSSSRFAQVPTDVESAAGNSANGAAQASTTTDIIEGWVGNNLDTFVGDATAQPSLTSADASNGGSSSASVIRPPSEQQSQQQQLNQSRQTSDNGSRQQQSKQQQGRGQKQGQKQGQYGSSGGAWAGVDDEMERARQLISPWRALVAPVVKGTEHLPDPLGPPRPILFVGNHTVIGLYDLPLLVYELYVRGYKVRGLAHPGHWKTPLGGIFESLGAVKASPMAAYRLLRNSEAVLLFPGGSREVNKRKGEKYKLIWKNKAEFVRLAAKTNALIIPFAAVGGEEAFDIALDSDEVLANPILGPLARGFSNRVFRGSPLEGSQDAIGPVTMLPGTSLPSLLPLPKLERLYFRFMPAVDASAELPDRNNAAEAEALYRRIKLSVEQGMDEAQQDRQADPERDLGKRLMGQVQRILPSWELLQG